LIALSRRQIDLVSFSEHVEQKQGHVFATIECYDAIPSAFALTSAGEPYFTSAASPGNDNPGQWISRQYSDDFRPFFYRQPRVVGIIQIVRCFNDCMRRFLPRPILLLKLMAVNSTKIP